MVYDETRRQHLLFGGTGAEGTSPSAIEARPGDGMGVVDAPRGAAYDEKTSALHLFSIGAADALLADRWNGTALTSVAAARPPCVPFQSQLTALGSNPGGLLLYIHGCGTSGMNVEPQRWRWDGAVWARVTGTQPPLRYNSAMAYDRDRARVVLYGGEVGAGTLDLADTWEFDGTTWTRR